MYLSKGIEDLVNEFAKLPGVGKKTAFRYALYFLNNSDEESARFADVLSRLKQRIKICAICQSPCDDTVCAICNADFRSKSQICVIESYKDLIAIENTKQYNGVYHVLGGVISPIDDIGPEKLNFSKLIERVKDFEEDSVELIMALNPTIEGDTTIYYITNLLKSMNVKITTISRGISFGSDLEYTDGLTLGRSIHARQPYDQLINK